MLYKELKKRALPPLPATREEMIDVIHRELFGTLPSPEFSYSVSEPTVICPYFANRTVTHSEVLMTVTIGGASNSFYIDRLLHTDGRPRPTVILNNFNRMGESRYFPIEEMSETDFNFLSIFYKDISSDDGDFSTGLAPMLLPNGQDTNTTCGKIGIWAWANMRVMDYALTLPETDAKNVAIVGHSRLGKTSLYTGMMDERFRFVYSNAAGCAGDTLAHGNTGFDRPHWVYQGGELIEDIVKNFPYWFCKNYHKYAERSIADCFDQHFLLATIAPRYLFIGTCASDNWADTKGEQLCALAASEAWERMGLSGFLDASDRYVEMYEERIDGHIGFAKANTFHFLTRHNWASFLRFMQKHLA
jgi:hypothetical protein